MAPQRVNGSRLKQALNRFGSVEKAVDGLQQEKATLEKSNSQLKEEIAQLKSTRDKLLLDVNESNRKLNDLNSEAHSLATKVNEHKRQYQLFEGFLTMIASLPKILDSGWYSSDKPDELRALFVRTTIGDYLRCFRCDGCGAKFIVNKEPHYKYVRNWYLCPSCHNSWQVKADDSFLKAMVTNEQLENTLRVEELQKENDILRPLKAFLNVACEICGQPMTE